LFFLIFFCQFLPNFLFNPNSKEIFQTVRVPTVFQNERICQKMNFLFSFRTVSTPKFRPKTQKVCQKNLLCKHLLATSPNGFSLLRAVDEVFYFSFLFELPNCIKSDSKTAIFRICFHVQIRVISFRCSEIESYSCLVFLSKICEKLSARKSCPQ
jgi:hypothetical protein